MSRYIRGVELDCVTRLLDGPIDFGGERHSVTFKGVLIFCHSVCHVSPRHSCVAIVNTEKRGERFTPLSQVVFFISVRL